MHLTWEVAISDILATTGVVCLHSSFIILINSSRSSRSSFKQ